jgi:hypothetical protein
MDSEQIQNISEKISEKHTKFLKSVGEIPYRISADYVLFLTMVSTKINLIANLLREREVIDGFKMEGSGECNKITLSKSGLDFKVEVLTNGTAICLRSVNGMLDNDSIFMTKQWYHPKKSGWDWEDFTEQLVDFIHYTMYKSQKAEEINFDTIMRGDCI